MWKQCPLQKGYMACTDGRVRNTKSGRIYQSDNNYVQVSYESLHRMVLGTFRPGHHTVWMPWVDHVEGVQAGNQLSNLRWSNPTLNAINKRKQPVHVARTAQGYYCVRVKVLKHVHSKTFKSREEAEACASDVRSRLFNSLECLFKFLARGNGPSPFTDYFQASQHLYRRFPSTFWRRLVRLPKGMITKPRSVRYTWSPYRSDNIFRDRQMPIRVNSVAVSDKLVTRLIHACRTVITLLGGEL